MDDITITLFESQRPSLQLQYCSISLAVSKCKPAMYIYVLGGE